MLPQAFPELNGFEFQHVSPAVFGYKPDILAAETGGHGGLRRIRGGLGAQRREHHAPPVMALPGADDQSQGQIVPRGQSKTVIIPGGEGGVRQLRGDAVVVAFRGNGILRDLPELGKGCLEILLRFPRSSASRRSSSARTSTASRT